MKRLKIALAISIFLAGFNLCASAQKSNTALVTPAYLTGIWLVRNIDTAFGHKQELKLKFSGKGTFEQWLEVDGNMSDRHKGVFKLKDNFLTFIDQKGRKNVYRIVQVGQVSFSIREKTARDIITLTRE